MSSEAETTIKKEDVNDSIEKKDSNESGDSSSGMGSFVDAGIDSDSNASGNDFSLVQEEDSKSTITTSTNGNDGVSKISEMDEDEKSQVEGENELIHTQSNISHFTTASQVTTHHTNTSSRFFGDIATSKSDHLEEEDEEEAESEGSEVNEQPSAKSFHKSLDEWEKFKMSLLQKDEDASKAETEEIEGNEEAQTAEEDDNKVETEIPKTIDATEEYHEEEPKAETEEATEVGADDNQEQASEVDEPMTKEIDTPESKNDKEEPLVEETTAEEPEVITPVAAASVIEAISNETEQAVVKEEPVAEESQLTSDEETKAVPDTSVDEVEKTPTNQGHAVDVDPTTVDESTESVSSGSSAGKDMIMVEAPIIEEPQAPNDSADIPRDNPFEADTEDSHDIEAGKEAVDTQPKDETQSQGQKLPGWLLPFARDTEQKAATTADAPITNSSSAEFKPVSETPQFDPYRKNTEQVKDESSSSFAPTIVTPPPVVQQTSSQATDREIEMQEMGQKSRGVLPIQDDSYVNISSKDVVEMQRSAESSITNSEIQQGTYTRHEPEKPSVVKSGVTKPRPFNLEKYVLVAVVAMVGGFFGTVYSTTSCEYATVYEPVGENQVVFEAHYGLWQYTTIDSVFMGYTYCTAYHADEYVTSPNGFAPIMGLLSSISASYTIAVIWVYLFFFMSPTLPGWLWAIRGALFAALSQILTLTFFMNEICQTYECTAGPGSISAIISALSWCFVAYQMNHNAPVFDDTNIEHRSCLGKLTYNIGIRMQPKGKTELEKVQELSSYQAPIASKGVSA